ncbi:uncharacterized protein LOC117185782 isoform X1 [Drosophila miranda]|uniref:uncharacterized protein LOC117185782 isoform X1 n=1 Tax=Drosophila miranda TaxID=7229 RepID=UPI0007E8259F|nr:uncharacterized protein LOC117185782 isoform X1 [Drosophila miranda]
MFKDWRRHRLSHGHRRWRHYQQPQKRLTDRETMILFVYDTECLKDEADDPIKAVLYFHPSWVSDYQKVALCGQLMGTTYFLRDCFFKPRVLALQNGKFVLKEFGRFTLAVGTDRNISDENLEHRAELLSSLLKFFHRDLQTLYDQYAQPPALNTRNLCDKLYQIFETYLPMMHRNGDTFQNVPRLRMPKTASHIFLEAIQVLQSCQETKGILGGVILYHNKVVASQLSDVVTKKLVLTDPRHIRNAAEQLTTQQFHVPYGVQMMVVYLDQKQYRQMVADAQRAQNLLMITSHTQSGMPFQSAKRKLKRDKSLIFTHIPEDEAAPVEPLATMPTARPKSMRPTFLPLRHKNMHSRELPETSTGAINFDETDSYPEYIGRTSVCNTPMTENKVLPVATVMSICANPEEEPVVNDGSNFSGKAESRRQSLKADVEKFFSNFIINPSKQFTRRKSSADLQDALRAISKKIRSFTPNFRPDVNRNGSGNGSGSSSDELSSPSPDYSEYDENSSARTINDPTYPVFIANGKQISRNLFQQFLDQYYKLWGVASAQAQHDAELAALVAEFQEFNKEVKKLDEHMRQQALAEGSDDPNLNLESRQLVKSPMEKSAMSLPLKPAGDLCFGEPSTAAPLQRGAGRSGAGAVPLTPLMAKLSVLALSETPSIEILTPLTSSMAFPNRSSMKCEDAMDAFAALSIVPVNPAPSLANGMQRTELYSCGQKNMTLLLLMEEGTSQKQNVVQKMFDICVAKFPHMESQLSQTLSVNLEGDMPDYSNYSFMCVDAKWDVLERSGPWNSLELKVVESMHTADADGKHGGLTDLILRSQDSVYYGHKCGRTEFYYKEPTHQINGIPPPSDPVSNIQNRAKAQLERDHSYMLF